MKQFTRRVILTGAAMLAAQARPLETLRLPKRLRLAVIGFDGHPTEVTSHLKLLPDIELVAIADADPAVLERQAKRLNNPKTYTDYRKMLDAEKLDLVAVCNNNGERAAAILAVTERKLNFIAEKPYALDMKMLKKVRQSVEQSKVRAGMLLPMRFSPQFLAMRQIVEKGVIGEVAQIGAQKSYKAGDRPAWFLNKATYGGTIPWIGIHMIDLMRWTSGREFKQAVGFKTRIGFPELKDMENVTASLFKLDNGGVGTLRMDYLRTATAPTHDDDRLRLAGLNGVLEYQRATGVTLMTKTDKPAPIPELPKPESVFLDYLAHTYNDQPTKLPMSDIWRVNEITLGAHEAAERGVVLDV